MTEVERPISPRMLAWSTIAGIACALALTVPVRADPVGVPDAGSRPAPSGELLLPGEQPTSPTPIVEPVDGPLAAQVMAKQTEVAMLGERRNALDEQLAQARERTAEAERIWRAAQDVVAKLREKAEKAAQAEYRAATELAPFGPLGMDLRDLNRLLPRQAIVDSDAELIARELARAEEDEQAKFNAYRDAQLVEQGIVVQRAQVNITFLRAEGEYRSLLAENQSRLAAIEAAQEAFERSQADKYGQPGINVDGLTANPKALGALRYALSHLGDPYEWGAEGPHRFDCSGLVWAAYRSVGVTYLPRVANDQWRATKSIPVSQLLPGDLVFFAKDKTDWRTIHHVGMYVGDGKMIHAPHTGDVVRIATVWWSRLFGATRVVDAVKAPSASPSPTPTPSAGPTTHPPGSGPSTGPSPIPSTEPPPTPSPTSSATPSPTPSTSPSPTPSAAPTPSAEPSATPSASPTAPPASPSASPSTYPPPTSFPD